MSSDPHTLLDPRKVATEIILSSGSTATLSMLEQLAVAISKGEGIARDGHELCIVLRNPLEACAPGTRPFIPTVIGTRIPTTHKLRRLRTTDSVAHHFSTRTKPGKLARLPGYAPGGADNVLVPLSGKSLADARTAVDIQHGTKTKPAKEVTWYNLADVPVGGIVYIVETSGQLVLTQKIDADHWFLIQAPRISDIADVSRAITRVMSEMGITEKPQGFEPLDGQPVLLR